MSMHGVGYYERFFGLTNGDQASFWHQYPKDTILMYIATELAYGNSGFIPSRMPDMMSSAQLEYKHVLPAQKLYANADIISITYYDNGAMVSVSQYIKNHPTTFDSITSVDFMSKIKVVYDNGTIVYVNRHPTQSWQITPGVSATSYNYHATINAKDSLNVTASTNITTWTLPKGSGWLVVGSLSTTSVFNNESIEPEMVLFPNPASSEIQIKLSGNSTSQIEISNSLGEMVIAQKNKTRVDVCKLPAGIYFVRATQGSRVYYQKFTKE